MSTGTGGSFGTGLRAPRMIDGVTVVGPFNSPGVSKTPSRERIFVCEPKTDWLVDDGVRLMPENKEDWRAFHELFCAFLDNANISYIMLSCDIADLKERVRLVVQHWEGTSESINPLQTIRYRTSDK